MPLKCYLILGSTWRIIPVFFQVVRMDPHEKSHGVSPFGRGRVTTRSLGDLWTMVINHLLSGMILQVPPKRCYFERLLLELSKRKLLLVYAFPRKQNEFLPWIPGLFFLVGNTWPSNHWLIFTGGHSFFVFRGVYGTCIDTCRKTVRLGTWKVLLNSSLSFTSARFVTCLLKKVVSHFILRWLWLVPCTPPYKCDDPSQPPENGTVQRRHSIWRSSTSRMLFELTRHLP